MCVRTLKVCQWADLCWANIWQNVHQFGGEAIIFKVHVHYFNFVMVNGKKRMIYLNIHMVKIKRITVLNPLILTPYQFSCSGLLTEPVSPRDYESSMTPFDVSPLESGKYTYIRTCVHNTYYKHLLMTYTASVHTYMYVYIIIHTCI